MVVLAALIGSTSIHAQEAPNFDFYGHVVSIPVALGETLEMYSVLTNNGIVPTPIPFNWTAEEHTLVLRAQLSSSSGFSQLYATGTVEIWTDIGPATPAVFDISQTGNFEDGTLVLSGAFMDTMTRNKFTPTLGSFGGSVNWTGGTRLAELGGSTNGWPFGGAISAPAQGAELFAERWDGKVDMPPIAVEQQTWGAVKGLYQGR